MDFLCPKFQQKHRGGVEGAGTASYPSYVDILGGKCASNSEDNGGGSDKLIPITPCNFSEFLDTLRHLQLFYQFVVGVHTSFATADDAF